MQETSRIDCDFSLDTSTHKDPQNVQGKKSLAPFYRNGSWSVVTATPYDDGYLWRKYGEKRINGSPFTRSYYRCSYRDEKGCQATRQVQQQSFSDPPLFLVTQKGEHTCNTVPEAQAHGYMVQHYCQQPDESTTPFLLQFNQSSNDDHGEKQPNYKSNSTTGGRNKEEEEEEACEDKNCTLLNNPDTDATFITSESTFTDGCTHESLPTISQEFDQFGAIISLDDFLL